MIGKFAILVAILQSVMSSSSKDSYVYDLEKPITDVRGGVALKVTYPTEVQNAIGNKGSMDVILGNFGHIQYGTSIQGELITRRIIRTDATSTLNSSKELTLYWLRLVRVQSPLR